MSNAGGTVRRIAALVAVGVLGVFVALLLASAASPHEDPGGPARVDDSVRLTELTALSDQDDGANGESEYCVNITFKHPPDHLDGKATSESVDCPSGVNWDDASFPGGPTWEQVGRLPLVGTGGYGGAVWEGPQHSAECVASASWTLSVNLTESNSLGIEQVLAEIGKALQQAGIPGDAGARATLVGRAAEIAGKILTELFGGLEQLGRTDLKWESGEGDPDGRVPKGPEIARHFSVGGEKTVARVQPDCTPPTTTTSPPPTTGGSATPPPVPTVPTQTTPSVTDTTPTETTPTEPTPTGTPSPEPTNTAVTGTTFTDTTPRGRGSSAATAAQARCHVPEGHVLCVELAAARRSWRSLRRATLLVGRVRAEERADRAEAARVRRQLLALIGTLAATAARDELREARARRPVIAGLRPLRRTAARTDVQRRRAVRSGSPRRMLRALAGYRRIHIRLAPRLHP